MKIKCCNVENVKPLRYCTNCGYLELGGYEYPEPYCSAGVPDNDPLFFGDGCIYTARQLSIKYDYNNR